MIGIKAVCKDCGAELEIKIDQLAKAFDDIVVEVEPCGCTEPDCSGCDEVADLEKQVESLIKRKAKLSG